MFALESSLTDSFSIVNALVMPEDVDTIFSAKSFSTVWPWIACSGWYCPDCHPSAEATSL
jgi:hypothetical protein